MKKGMLLGVLAVLASGAASAHEIWSMPDQIDIKPGHPITVSTVIGENYPAGSVLPLPDKTSISVYGPDGKESPLTFAPSGLNQVGTFTPGTSGQYMVVSKYENYFVRGLKGPEASYSKDRLGGRTYDSCIHIVKCGKTVLGAGDVALKPIGLPLEIVPAEDPTQLHVGDLLPVTLLFHGKPMGPGPMEEVELKAVYPGFQKDDNTFAFLARPSAEGKLRIQLTAPGWWMAAVEYHRASEDPAKEDMEAYVGTLVFHVARR